jgi:plastocyanin
MQSFFSSRYTSFLLSLLALPIVAAAQTTHVVQVEDFRFVPRDITIQAGDTVRWENPPNPGGMWHNLVGEAGAFQYQQGGTSWFFEHTFTEGGTVAYWCTPHRFSYDMEGSVTVEGGIVEPGFEINAGLNGNWWAGASRNGEGAQIEVSDAGGGELVFVVTMYSYGPEGGQIFLVGVGTPEGDSVTVAVYIYDGATWGADFDPGDVNETPWGSGEFTSESCDLISMVLTPNAEQLSLGYTELAYDLIRLTTPSIPCPFE